MNQLTIYDNLSWQKWLKTYKNDIRCFVMWDELKDFETSLEVVRIGTIYSIYKAWHRNGTWISGEPEQYKMLERNENILLRVPGIKIGHRIILLDGNHRLTVFEPGILFVDCIIVKVDNRHCFGDLLNIQTRDWFENQEPNDSNPAKHEG